MLTLPRDSIIENISHNINTIDFISLYMTCSQIYYLITDCEYISWIQTYMKHVGMSKFLLMKFEEVFINMTVYDLYIRLSNGSILEGHYFYNSGPMNDGYCFDTIQLKINDIGYISGSFSISDEYTDTYKNLLEDSSIDNVLIGSNEEIIINCTLKLNSVHRSRFEPNKIKKIGSVSCILKDFKVTRRTDLGYGGTGDKWTMIVECSEIFYSSSQRVTLH